MAIIPPSKFISPSKVKPKNLDELFEMEELPEKYKIIVARAYKELSKDRQIVIKNVTPNNEKDIYLTAEKIDDFFDVFPLNIDLVVAQKAEQELNKEEHEDAVYDTKVFFYVFLCNQIRYDMELFASNYKSIKNLCHYIEKPDIMKIAKSEEIADEFMKLKSSDKAETIKGLNPWLIFCIYTPFAKSIENHEEFNYSIINSDSLFLGMFSIQSTDITKQEQTEIETSYRNNRADDAFSIICELIDASKIKGFRASTQKLFFEILCQANTQRNNIINRKKGELPIVRLDINEFINKTKPNCKDKKKSEIRNNIEEDIKIIETTRVERTIIDKDGAEIKFSTPLYGGSIKSDLRKANGKYYYDYILPPAIEQIISEENKITHCPTALLTISDRRQNAFGVAIRLACHYSMLNNQAKGNHNFMSVKTLLKFFSSLNTPEQVKNRKYKEYIVTPVINTLNTIADTGCFIWKFCTKDRQPIPELQEDIEANITYNIFMNSYITFEFFDFPEIKQKRKQLYKNAEQQEKPAEKITKPKKIIKKAKSKAENQ